MATFAVRVVGAKTSEYTFTPKRDTKPVTQHKFEAWLVGINAQGYCVGFVKGTQAAVKQAQTKYTEGSVWALSKVVFDTYTAITFVSTPVPFSPGCREIQDGSHRKRRALPANAT